MEHKTAFFTLYIYELSRDDVRALEEYGEGEAPAGLGSSVPSCVLMCAARLPLRALEEEGEAKSIVVGDLCWSRHLAAFEVFYEGAVIGYVPVCMSKHTSAEFRVHEMLSDPTKAIVGRATHRLATSL